MEPLETITFALAGELAEWLNEEADRNTRTPSQHVVHLLGGIKASKERAKQANEERKAKREALGFGGSRKRLEQQAA